MQIKALVWSLWTVVIQEAERHLNDSATYCKLDTDPSSVFYKDIKVCVLQLEQQGIFSKDMRDFALITDSTPGRFYLLPKVHKRGVPGRPVISSYGSLTENISVIVDRFLKPHIPSIPSYVRDTNHFLERLRNLVDLPVGALLVTLDVTALYPSIPHEDGLSS